MLPMWLVRICVLFFSLWPALLFAARVDTVSNPTGIRIGYDLSRTAVSALVDGRVEQEVFVNMNFGKTRFAVVEFGMADYFKQPAFYDYYQTGQYGRLGVDFNMNKSDRINIFTLGARIAGAQWNNRAENILVPFPDTAATFATTIPEFSDQALWGEITFGMQASFLKYFFLGWTVRGKVLILKPDDRIMRPYYIPGYGRYKGNAAAGFNYYIGVRIPF